MSGGGGGGGGGGREVWVSVSAPSIQSKTQPINADPRPKHHSTRGGHHLNCQKGPVQIKSYCCNN